MAYTKVQLTNGIDLRTAPVGFSWTTFFFGCLPAFIRGHWQWGLLILVLSIFTYGIAAWVVAFFYNKIYIKHLLASGYKFSNLGIMSEEMLKSELSLVTVPRI